MMTLEKPVATIFFGICALIFVLLLWTTPGKTSNNESSEDAEAVAALLGTGSGNKTQPLKRKGDSSFFEDPDFMESGVGENNIDEENADSVKNKTGDEPDILEPVNKNNPKNPQTGQQYTDQAMSKFKVLRKRFPKNNLIPKRKTAKEKQAESDSRNRMYGLQSLVVQGGASEQEVNDYYDMQTKSYSDRKELLEYVFETMGERMSDEIKGQYNKILTMNKKQISRLNEQRTRALTRVD